MRKSPRYLVFRNRKDGAAAYFCVPERLRPEGWPATYSYGLVRNEKEKGDAIKWAIDLGEKLDAERAGERRGPNEGSIPHLIRIIETKPDDVYKWTSISEGSRKTYREAFKLLSKWSASIKHPPASQLTPQGITRLFVQLADRPHMRRLVAAALSKLLDVAVIEGLAPKNAMADTPPPPTARSPEANRDNIWPDDYFETCLRGAVERQEWALARGLAFQRYHAQRPSDAIRLHTDWLKDGRLEFRQQKTGRQKRGGYVRVPIDSAFRAILDKAQAQIGPLTLNGDRAHTDKSYRDAIYALQEALGLPRRAPKYLRHTGILEMARAPLTEIEIAQRTGHSPANVTQILRHYLPQDDDLKEAASAKVEAFRENASRTRELNAVERKGGK